MSLKKISIAAAFVFGIFSAQAQQYPFWTHTRSTLFLNNPAVAGTRKTLDARMSYRQQWMGFDGAPKTSTIGIHGRFYKGKMGAGGFIYTDKIGPSSFTAYSASFAYHIKFEDTELSFGVNGSYNVQLMDPNKITYHNSQDFAAESAIAYNKSKIPNAAFGVLYYNDRFYLGASVNNLLGSSYEFPKSADKKGHMQTVPHYSLNIGYNWASDPNYIFENSVFVNYVAGTPILLDYNLRFHIKHAFFVGAGIRMKSAVIFQTGVTIDNTMQIAYSYDFTTNALRTFNTGTHEIKFVYTYDKDRHQKHGQNSGFARQHYHLL